MRFGIFSNGFRPHTSAARTYDEDLFEIALADELGFTEAYISEHHGEPPYIGAVDTIPDPELMMCKAAALTKRIRMGSAVKLIHLHHPLDVAIRSAVTSHMLGGRYIFGFGTGFPTPLFCNERGLSYEDRHERLAESLEFIFKCWSSDAPFDWSGKHWQGTGVVALPKPERMPAIATATDSDSMIKLCGARGWTLLTAFLEPAPMVRAKAEKYAAAAPAAARDGARANVAASRMVYVSDSRRQGMDEMRDAVTYEVRVQEKRGFLAMLRRVYGIDVPNGRHAIDALVEAGLYIVGEPDAVAGSIRQFHADCGGFGTFLFVTGKDWATREKRARSMKMFNSHVMPQLADLP